MPALSVLILCQDGDPGMLGSFGRAFRGLGHRVRHWSLSAAIDSHVKFDRIGRLLSSYFPFDPWLVGGNRDLIEETMAFEPDLLLFAGQQPVRAGALAQIKVARPRVQTVMTWPDTLLNLTDRAIACLPMCDLVASYSKAAIPLLERFGARTVSWVPFGVDTELFPTAVDVSPDELRRLGSDVAFVGNHRPAREAAVLRLLDAGLDVKVWGTGDWIKRAGAPARVRTYFQGGPLFGAALVKALRSAKVSLNVIDPTNYPAANMRFFEQVACGVASLSSACPEMESLFPDGDCVSYYQENNLAEKARELVANRDLRERLAKNGQRAAMAAHTYSDRARAILHAVGLAS
jgi:glycosyltransferase involved in cell wall biosynthesis